jgi:hypothetical protein
MQAPLPRVAGIGRAQVVIIALQETAVAAFARLAGVRQGAGVAVIAGCVVGHKEAFSRVAAVVSTRVAVIANKGFPPLTEAIDALVPQGAAIAIVTEPGHNGVLAAIQEVAAISGAGVLVIAVQISLGHTLACLARVPGGAGVAVTARAGLRGMHAAGFGRTFVQCTGVVIVAGQWRTWDAGPVTALVVNGAHVAIEAILLVIDVKAAGVFLATIIGAGVTIIAIGLLASRADAV